ncbi:MAG: translational GTPase TypA [Cytophagales bacterium]|nr:translational GTPase TypA [Cytophagales bacterium]
MNSRSIRNLAIIAHVDHGKTTLVNNILQQTNIFRDNQDVVDRIMDSGDLEKERGITILAKVTSVFYKDLKFNIVDTPGHADFGGEVERVLSMVDGVVLLVDSSEGVMPQTKFVLGKALKLGLKPIVVINKVDRQDERCAEVLGEIEDLFLTLDATEEQLEFPVLYAVGRDGWATTSHADAKDIIAGKKSGDLQPLFELIENFIPAPQVDINKPFEMLATILTADSFVGKILIGKVYNGVAKVNSQVKVLDLAGKTKETTKLTKLFSFKGIEKYPIDQAIAGDIVAIAGVEGASVSDTICDTSVNVALTTTPVDPPTMSITIGVNDSPFAGQEGKKITSRQILERLRKEEDSNVAIKVTVDPNNESFEVGGRGELQLGVLIEQMRREGFELSVGRPKVLFKVDKATGTRLEPIEEVVIDVDEVYSGEVIQKISQRKGEMKEMKPSGVGKVKIIFYVPSRGLIGYQTEFRNDTHGNGVMNRSFYGYQEYKGDIEKHRNGVLVSSDTGETTSYALNKLSDRGVMFVPPRVKVYRGMIVGEHTRENDLEVNPVKAKELTNMRSATADIAVKLAPHKTLVLEEMISYIQDDELVEVTPLSLRLRKKNIKR